MAAASAAKAALELGCNIAQEEVGGWLRLIVPADDWRVAEAAEAARCFLHGATAEIRDKLADAHLLRLLARRQALRGVRASRNHAEGASSIDIEASSAPAWVKFRKKLDEQDRLRLLRVRCGGTFSFSRTALLDRNTARRKRERGAAAPPPASGSEGEEEVEAAEGRREEDERALGDRASAAGEEEEGRSGADM